MVTKIVRFGYAFRSILPSKDYSCHPCPLLGILELAKLKPKEETGMGKNKPVLLDHLIISNAVNIRYSEAAKSLIFQSAQVEHGTEYDLVVEIYTEALLRIILALKHFASRLGITIEDLAKPPIVQ